MKGIVRVCLNIDSDPDRKGQVLSITDPTTDLTIEYKTKFVSENDIANYASEMKIEYQNPDLSFISPAFFGGILEDVSKITVCANLPKMRYPSGCAYDFDNLRKPKLGCGLPLNFDYGSVFYMVQATLPVGVSEQSISRALAEVRSVSYGEGFGHPGITTDRTFLAELDRASCNEIEDDVIKTPYYDGWKDKAHIDPDHWFPVLREDGFLGIFRDDSRAASTQEDTSGVVKYHIIAHNALAYFACDQLRVLIETNAKNWTWEDWKNSVEVKRTTEFSTLVAKAVCDRMLVALDALEYPRSASEALESSRARGCARDSGSMVSSTTPGALSALRATRTSRAPGASGAPGVSAASGASTASGGLSDTGTSGSSGKVTAVPGSRYSLKQTKAPLITTFNILNPDPLKIDTNRISYDADIVRSSNWSKEGILTRVIDTEAEYKRFVWIKNLKCENGYWTTKIDKCKNDVLIPATADDDTVDDICSRLKKLPEFTLHRVDLVSLKEN